MLDPKFTKAVSSVISIQNDIDEPVTITGSSVTFTLCNRTDTVTNRANYFVSFNLPTEPENLATGSTLSLLHPELQQLNTNKIIALKIPNTAYAEYIDGRSIELSVPITGSSTQYYKIYSSTYTSDKALREGETSPLLGDNIAFLFCDNINRPYTGLTTNDIGIMSSQSAFTSWNPTGSYLNRPAAVSYMEVQGNVNAINTDRRPKRNINTIIPCSYPSSFGHSAKFYDTYFSAASTGFVVRPGHGFKVGDLITIDKDNKFLNPSYDSAWTITSIVTGYSLAPYFADTFDVLVTNCPWVNASFLESGCMYEGSGAYYNYDIPVGFVILDKGIIVLTHKYIVDQFEWTGGTTSSGGAYTETGTDTDKLNIYFNTTNVYLRLVSIKRKFITSTVCMALNGEFYISNNPTWNRTIALEQFGSNVPLQITELGLYNAFGELIAVTKFSSPIQRQSDDIMTFYINLNM